MEGDMKYLPLSLSLIILGALGILLAADGAFSVVHYVQAGMIVVCLAVINYYYFKLYRKLRDKSEGEGGK